VQVLHVVQGAGPLLGRRRRTAALAGRGVRDEVTAPALGVLLAGESEPLRRLRDPRGAWGLVRPLRPAGETGLPFGVGGQVAVAGPGTPRPRRLLAGVRPHHRIGRRGGRGNRRNRGRRRDGPDCHISTERLLPERSWVTTTRAETGRRPSVDGRHPVDPWMGGTP